MSSTRPFGPQPWLRDSFYHNGTVLQGHLRDHYGDAVHVRRAWRPTLLSRRAVSYWLLLEW